MDINAHNDRFNAMCASRRNLVAAVGGDCDGWRWPFRGVEACGGPATGGVELCYQPWGANAMLSGDSLGAAVSSALRTPRRVVTGGNAYGYSTGETYTPTEAESAAAVAVIRALYPDPAERVAAVMRYYAARRAGETRVRELVG